VRDIAFAFLTLLCVVMCLRSAFASLLMWAWVGLIAIQHYSYGLLDGFQYGTIFAGLTVVLTLMKRDTDPIEPTINGLGILLIAFGLHAVVSSLLAYPNLARMWEITINLNKNILFALMVPILVTTRERLQALILMICLAIPYHGMMVGLKFLASGGSHNSLGNGKFVDRNDLAVLITMCVPLLWYMATYAKHHLARLVAYGALLLNVLGIISTQSRGGFLALLAAAIYFALRSSRKIASISVILLAGIVGLALAPDSWFDRMQSIQTADDDGSFMGRVTAWKRSSAIALDHPIFGGGIRSVQSAELMEKHRFSPGLLGWVDTPSPTYAAAAHSIYFEVMGDVGFVGLALFLMIMLFPFFCDLRIRSQVRQLGPPAEWARDLSMALCCGMFAFLVGGASISAAYFEIGYYFVACSGVLYLILKKEILAAGIAHRAGVHGQPRLQEKP
jgi:probable O-glycosylation ligase (exosortase A-associated)